MGSYNNEPVIFTGGVTNTTAQKSQSSKNNFSGASGQTAVALGIALVNLYIYFQDQMELKGEQITNVQAAAEGQSKAQIAAGHKAFLGYLTQGLSSIAMGGFTAFSSSLEGKDLINNTMKQGALKTEAPTTLNKISAEFDFDGSPDAINAGKTALPNDELGKILRDPTELDEASFNRLKDNHYLTTDQVDELQAAARQFQAGTAPLQKELQKSSASILQNWNVRRDIVNSFLRASGELGQGTFKALETKDQAAGTLDQAAQTMAQGAQDVISGAVQQWMTLIELLLQTQTAAANVNRG